MGSEEVEVIGEEDDAGAVLSILLDQCVGIFSKDSTQRQRLRAAGHEWNPCLYGMV